MFPPVNNLHRISLWLMFALCSTLVLLLCSGSSEASIYHKKGICSYKDKFFKPGDSFRRGCDKCFCHEFGFYCYAPMKPTSWPKKCRRVRTDCGYKFTSEVSGIDMKCLYQLVFLDTPTRKTAEEPK